MQGHASLIRVDNIELQLGQNLLHGFQVQSCPGDVRFLFIFLLQRQKTACLADGVGDALLLVGLRLAQPGASLAPCFGNEVARVARASLITFSRSAMAFATSWNAWTTDLSRVIVIMLADTMRMPLRRRSKSSCVSALTRSCTATRPLVSTSSMDMPMTVSVSTPSATAST